MSMSTDKPVGDTLKINREAQHLTPEDIVSILKIRLQLVHTIETDDYPSQDIDVFLKGHIISYCRYLNINPQTVLNKLEAKGYNLPMTEQAVQSKTIKKKWPVSSIAIIMVLISIWATLPKHKPTTMNITQPVRYGDFQ